MARHQLTSDPILAPFLSAEDPAETDGQLALLISEHAEPKIRAIVWPRLSSGTGFLYDHRQDYEDLVGEVRAKLLAFLQDLKANSRAKPCKDILGYINGITNNACNDYFRRIYPERARLAKRIRDFIAARPDFALWESRDRTRGEWLCGFKEWRKRKPSSVSASWLETFRRDTTVVVEALSQDSGIQSTSLAHLLTSIFNEIGEPFGINELVDLVADLKGIRDMPMTSIEANAARLSAQLPDTALRIESMLEMREPLRKVWKGLREFPADQLKSYLFYARDQFDEDLINRFLAARVATEDEIAALLGMTRDRLRDLRLNELPLDNASIAKELKVTAERAYKLRRQAIRRIESLFVEITAPKKIRDSRKNRQVSPSYKREGS